MELNSYTTSTTRRIVDYSPLKTNQDWFFELVYDMTAFERQVIQSPWPPDEPTDTIPIFNGFSGRATNIFRASFRRFFDKLPTPD